jgi:hypothetical protein
MRRRRGGKGNEGKVGFQVRKVQDRKIRIPDAKLLR